MCTDHASLCWYIRNYALEFYKNTIIFFTRNIKKRLLPIKRFRTKMYICQHKKGSICNFEYFRNKNIFTFFHDDFIIIYQLSVIDFLNNIF